MSHKKNLPIPLNKNYISLSYKTPVNEEEVKLKYDKEKQQRNNYSDLVWKQIERRGGIDADKDFDLYMQRMREYDTRPNMEYVSFGYFETPEGEHVGFTDKWCTNNWEWLSEELRNR